MHIYLYIVNLGGEIKSMPKNISSSNNKSYKKKIIKRSISSNTSTNQANNTCDNQVNKNDSNSNNINNNSSNNSNCSNNNGNGNNGNNNNDSSDSKLCCFGYLDYIVLASTLSVALAEELNVNDLNILSTFLAVLSDELALVASVKSCNPGSSDDVFVPPIPDVAITRASKKNKTRIKKVTRKKIKKK